MDHDLRETGRPPHSMETRAQLDLLAEALVDRETLDEQEILMVTGLPSAPALESRRRGGSDIT